MVLPKVIVPYGTAAQKGSKKVRKKERKKKRNKEKKDGPGPVMVSDILCPTLRILET